MASIWRRRMMRSPLFWDERADVLGYAVRFADLDADGVPELLIQAAGRSGLTAESDFRGRVYGVKLN